MNLASIFGAPLPKGVGDADPSSKQLRGLKKACEQFEAVFAKQLLSEMRKGSEQTSMGGGSGMAIYQDMMDQTIADSVAHTGGLGIGRMLYKEFESQVEASSTNTAQSKATSQTVTNEN